MEKIYDATEQSGATNNVQQIIINEKQKVNVTAENENFEDDEFGDFGVASEFENDPSQLSTVEVEEPVHIEQK